MIEIGKSIVELALKLGAEESEVFILKGSGTGLSIEKNSVGYASSGIEFGIGIRVIKEGRVGFAFCTKVSNAEKAVREALAVSKLGRKREYSFPEPKPVRKIDAIYDESILKFDSDFGLEKVSEIIDSALSVNKDITVSSGGFGFGESSFAIVNSKGVEVFDRGTYVYGSAYTVLRNGETTTGFEFETSRIFNINVSEIGRRAAEMTMKGRDAKNVETKDMTVLFTPYTLAGEVGGLFEFITAPAFYGEAAHKKESVYSGKVGECVTSESISIIDDGSLPNGLNSAVADDEGIPSKRVEIVKDGVLQGFLYDTATASEYNKESTGSAVRCERWASTRSFKSLPTTRSRNLTIEGEKQRLDELISDVREGVIVYEVLGAHTSNPASGDFSVNSSLLFKIENGEIVHPIKQAMISGNFHECLKRISGIGDDYKRLSGGLSTVSVFAPTIRIEKVRVTG